jgi:small multidrug resistance family-3 protein
MNPTEFIRSIVLFLLAGIAEIGGGYLVWLWLREGRPWWIGLLGGIVLIGYGVIPTLQPAQFDFAKVYAAYGGVFIILSLLWGRIVEGKTPDTPSIIGAIVALVGAAVIIYWPRS